jgi:protein TonB
VEPPRPVRAKAAERAAEPRAASPAARPPKPAQPAASGFDLAAFRSAVASRLAAAKRYPASARARGATGTAVVAFSIDAGGALAGVSLTRSSGQPDIDAEAVASVHRAAPFPAPPPGAPRSFSVPMSFQLR